MQLVEEGGVYTPHCRPIEEKMEGEQGIRSMIKLLVYGMLSTSASAISHE
jgi:hypothetical protein